MSNILKELQDRGLINNITNKEKVDKAFEAGKPIYIGFDPSFNSLHLGNYLMLTILKRLALNNYEVYALIGTATGMIGDPSGKKAERLLQDPLTIKNNALAIKQQIQNLCPVKIIENHTFYEKLSVVDFLRDVGKLININYLLEKETIKTRLETGISFTEFSYPLLQGYDFYNLYSNHNVCIQMGGSDQWGNITTGIEMIRKIVGDDSDACGLTINLLTKSDGTKFGKSEKGAIYLDKNITSPYQMYQFLYNQSDSDVEKLLLSLTFYSVQEINQIMSDHKANPKLRIAQNALCKDIVSNIHGVDEYNKAKKLSEHLFNEDFNNLTKEEIFSLFDGAIKYEINEPKGILDILVDSKLLGSKRLAREMVLGKAITIDGKVCEDINYKIDPTNIKKDFCLIKKGKKNYLVLLFNKID